MQKLLLYTKEFLSQFSRREHILFAVMAIYLAIHFAQSLLYTLISYQGLNLDFVQSMFFKVVYPVLMLYALTRRDLWYYGFILVLVTFGLLGTIGILALMVKTIGFSVTFIDAPSSTFLLLPEVLILAEHPYFRIVNWLRMAEILLSISVIILTYRLFKPLFDERRRLKKMSDTGLITHYVNTAREAYRLWMIRDIPRYNSAHETLLMIYLQLKKRDPALKGLYSLLKEPDDWVRITAARKLLGRPDGLALQTLDAIGEQHSEWSRYARNMAQEWRAGKLKPWK